MVPLHMVYSVVAMTFLSLGGTPDVPRSAIARAWQHHEQRRLEASLSATLTGPDPASGAQPIFGFICGCISPRRAETHFTDWGEPPCRASPSGRPGRTRRGDKVGFRFRLHGRSTSPSRQSPQVERESDQSTRKRPSPTQQFATNPSPDSRCRAARSGEWRQVLVVDFQSVQVEQSQRLQVGQIAR